MADERSFNRRRFFREGLRELMKPLGSAIEPLEEAVRQFERLSQTAPTPAQPPRTTSLPIRADGWLRPPGALPGQSFTDTCSRCGDCVRVCPAQCIVIDETGLRGNGAPFIDAGVMPCVVCDGLLCMHACPTGALTPIPLADIDMGTAMWREEHCLRTRAEDCTICVDQCPIGAVAIELTDTGRINVIEDGCIGCGVCEHYCPTTPKSIVVTPRDAGAGIGETVSR
jgi:MauM/NapG family ferredoxin protein